MKQSEIAPRVFETLERTPATELRGGPLSIAPSDLAGLSLVPWFCEGCVQWAVRIVSPGQPFRKAPFKKIKGTHVAITTDGALLVGVPGDGIDPSTWALFPLAEAIAGVTAPGMMLELAAANLGVVKRDWEVKAETLTSDGNHCYTGVIDESGRWQIERTIPGLDREELEAALTCGGMVVRKGPWNAASREEAIAIAVRWFASPEANVNPLAVRYFFRFRDGQFVNSDPKMDRQLPGLGLGFFRQRLAGSSFRWTTGPSQGIYTLAQLEEMARDVVDQK